MARLRAIGAVVRLDHEPWKRFARPRRQPIPTHDGDTPEPATEYAGRRWALCRMYCWVEAEWPDGDVGRRDVMVIEAVWLRRGDEAAVHRHALEMFDGALPELAARLPPEIGVTYERLIEMPATIEFGGEVGDLVLTQA